MQSTGAASTTSQQQDVFMIFVFHRWIHFCEFLRQEINCADSENYLFYPASPDPAYLWLRQTTTHHTAPMAEEGQDHSPKLVYI